MSVEILSVVVSFLNNVVSADAPEMPEVDEYVSITAVALDSADGSEIGIVVAVFSLEA